MYESIIDMFLTGITIILVIIASTIIELALYGSRLIIWLAVLEIVNPEPDSSTVQICIRFLFRFLAVAARILLYSLPIVCIGVFMNCVYYYFHNHCNPQRCLTKTILQFIS